MTTTELRNFLKATDALGERLPDVLTIALLKVLAGMSRKEIQQHVSVDDLLRTGWVEQTNGRVRLTASAKVRLGITGKKKKEADPRVYELIHEYREIIKETHHFDPCDRENPLHEYGGIARAAKAMLREASLHPKLKNYSPDEQLQGIVRIMRSMAFTTDKYDLRSFLSQRWHLAAFVKQFFKYINDMLEVQDRKAPGDSREQSPVEKPVETGRTSL